MHVYDTEIVTFTLYIIKFRGKLLSDRNIFVYYVHKVFLLMRIKDRRKKSI